MILQTRLTAELTQHLMVNIYGMKPLPVRLCWKSRENRLWLIMKIENYYYSSMMSIAVDAVAFSDSIKILLRFSLVSFSRSMNDVCATGFTYQLFPSFSLLMYSSSCCHYVDCIPRPCYWHRRNFYCIIAGIWGSSCCGCDTAIGKVKTGRDSGHVCRVRGTNCKRNQRKHSTE